MHILLIFFLQTSPSWWSHFIRAFRGRRAKLRRLHDPCARISFSLYFIQHPSSSLLRLSHRHKVSQAHRTRFAATTLHPALFLHPSLPNALAVRHPRFSYRSSIPPSSSTPLCITLTRYPLFRRPFPRVSPPLSVCHETRVKTYLVRFRAKEGGKREWERKRGRKRGSRAGWKRDARNRPRIFIPLASRCPLGSPAAPVLLQELPRHRREPRWCRVRRTISLFYPGVAHRDPGPRARVGARTSARPFGRLSTVKSMR